MCLNVCRCDIVCIKKDSFSFSQPIPTCQSASNKFAKQSPAQHGLEKATLNNRGDMMDHEHANMMQMPDASTSTWYVHKIWVVENIVYFLFVSSLYIFPDDYHHESLW